LMKRHECWTVTTVDRHEVVDGGSQKGK